MDPSRKITSNMKSLRTNMLQIPWKIRGSNSKMLQQFNTVEMSASSSKFLQIVRETDRTADPEKDPKTDKNKNNSQDNSGPITKCGFNLCIG